MKLEQLQSISCKFKCKFNITTFNMNQKWNKKHVKVNINIIVSATKIIVEILAQVFVRIASI